MTCGLSKDQLAILYYLYSERAGSVKSSRSHYTIKRDLAEKIPNYVEVLKSLEKAGYVGSKKKDGKNYWVNLGKVMSVLKAHDYPLSMGGVIRYTKIDESNHIEL